MGGAFGDTIEIVGTTNVVLGDGGLAEYDKSNVSNMVNSGLQKVETQADAEGGVDDIDIRMTVVEELIACDGEERTDVALLIGLC